MQTGDCTAAQHTVQHRDNKSQFCNRRSYPVYDPSSRTPGGSFNLITEIMAIYQDYIPIDPNCSKGRMVGLNCVFLTRPLPYSGAKAECAKDGFQLWSSDKQNITLETDQIFNGTNHYWILNAGEQ